MARRTILTQLNPLPTLHTKMSQNAPEDLRFEGRLARVESLVEQLVTEWKQERSNVRGELQNLANAISSGKAPNWGAIAVFVTAISMAGALVGFMLHSIQSSMAEQQKVVHELDHRWYEREIENARRDENAKVRLQLLDKLDADH